MNIRLSRRAFVSALVAYPVAVHSREVMRYADRTDFVWAVQLKSRFAQGAVVEAGGFHYILDGGQTLYDLPGWSGLGSDGFLAFEHFGAVGDGVADDAKAIRAALKAGVRIDGGSRTYGVGGKISLPAGTHLEDVKFRQLRSGSATATTLSAVDVDHVVLRRVSVDRNGDGRNGGQTRNSDPNWALNSAVAIDIQRGSWHSLENLEVFGNDSGTAIRFRGLDGRNVITTPYVHDMHCERDEIRDDVLQAIWFDDCKDLTVTCRVHDLTTRSAGGEVTTRSTRGVVCGGCTNLTIDRSEIANVDQGIDFTGSAGNLRCKATNNRIVQPYSVGVKFANSAVECQALRNWVYRPGRNAIIVSGPAEVNIPIMTEDCLVEGNVGIDVGYGRRFPNRTYGVFVERQPDHRNHPRGTVVRDNIMNDTQAQPTMLYGIYCDTEPQPGDPANVSCGNISSGYVKGAEAGLQGTCAS